MNPDKAYIIFRTILYTAVSTLGFIFATDTIFKVIWAVLLLLVWGVGIWMWRNANNREGE